MEITGDKTRIVNALESLVRQIGQLREVVDGYGGPPIPVIPVPNIEFPILWGSVCISKGDHPKPGEELVTKNDLRDAVNTMDGTTRALLNILK
jgi:hypothetical protein